jgi:hypothetical protein
MKEILKQSAWIMNSFLSVLQPTTYDGFAMIKGMYYGG